MRDESLQEKTTGSWNWQRETGFIQTDKKIRFVPNLAKGSMELRSEIPGEPSYTAIERNDYIEEYLPRWSEGFNFATVMPAEILAEVLKALPSDRILVIPVSITFAMGFSHVGIAVRELRAKLFTAEGKLKREWIKRLSPGDIGDLMISAAK